ncbi:MAG TPA: sigma factor, ECF subfamily protein, partial [Cytophagales bacterium]|nr:sigma factor, ECF subfamily protein [Cytophagales bacterium]
MAVPEAFESVVDHFFRHEYGRVTSFLSHRFGTTHLEQIEDAVQEALYKAMKAWAYGGLPDSPTAWIVKTAQNNLMDQVRRQQNFEAKHADEWVRMNETVMEAEDLDEELTDDTLRMMFACCHPSIRQDYQVLLTLKILCGLNNREVARALLKKEDTIAKGYTRARQQLREGNIELTVPLGAGLGERLDQVLKVLYLLFNEGYTASEGSDLVRLDLCAEAIRLSELILERP